MYYLHVIFIGNSNSDDRITDSDSTAVVLIKPARSNVRFLTNQHSILDVTVTNISGDDITDVTPIVTTKSGNTIVSTSLNSCSQLADQGECMFSINLYDINPESGDILIKLLVNDNDELYQNSIIEKYTAIDSSALNVSSNDILPDEVLSLDQAHTRDYNFQVINNSNNIINNIHVLYKVNYGNLSVKVIRNNCKDLEPYQKMLFYLTLE